MVVAATLALPGAARAQHLLDQYINADIPGAGIEPGVTVLSRQRPEYDSLGIRLGEVTIRPQLQETVGYDDNVLATRSAHGSAVIETNAQVQALYDHSDTKGFMAASVDDNRFPQQQQQSYTNWTAALGGSHDFGRDTLSASYQHLNLNQTLRDLDVPQLDHALAFRVDTARVAYRALFNRVFVEPNLLVSNYSFDNGTVNGQPYLQSYRNRVVVQPGTTVGYELSPRRNLVLVMRDAIGSYTTQVAGLPRQDFNDAAVLFGLDFDADGIWRYRLLAGYERRTFVSRQIKTIEAPIVEAQVIWNPTGLITLTGAGTRRIQDSADDNTAAFVESAVNLRVDYELQRNVLLRASGGLLHDDYSQGQGAQDLYTFGGGATWLLNRNMQLRGDYDYTRRLSSNTGNLGGVFGQQFGQGFGQAFGQSFAENRFLLQLRLAL